MVPRNSAPGGFAYIWQSKWIAIIAIKTERSQIHFLSDVFVAAASLDLKMPIFSVERTRRGLNIFSKTESGEHMATDLIRKIKYKWHLLRNARLPPESFELFPLYPLGSLVLQGNLDKWDMTEAWRKMQRCPWQSLKNWLSKSKRMHVMNRRVKSKLQLLHRAYPGQREASGRCDSYAVCIRAGV